MPKPHGKPRRKPHFVGFAPPTTVRVVVARPLYRRGNVPLRGRVAKRKVRRTFDRCDGARHQPKRQKQVEKRAKRRGGFVRARKRAYEPRLKPKPPQRTLVKRKYRLPIYVRFVNRRAVVAPLRLFAVVGFRLAYAVQVNY